MTDTKPIIAILGGTGDLGTGLGRRWARAGYPVIIGSRGAEKAAASAQAMNEALGGSDVRGLANPDAARDAEIVVLTVPFESQAATIDSVREHCRGKLFVDATVPLMPPKVGTVQLPEEGCAAVRAQKLLGEDLDCDVLVAGDKVAARETVVSLVEAAGLRGWHAGPLANSAAAEALTSVIIQINRRYKIDGAGIRITGKPGA